MNLNAKHYMLAEILADPSDGRTHPEKAAAAGLSWRSVYRLLKTPEFVAELQKNITLLTAPLRAKAYRTLDSGMDSIEGSVAISAARTILTATGDIGGQNINIHTEVHTEKKPLEEALPEWRRDRGLEVEAVVVKLNGKGRNGGKR